MQRLLLVSVALLLCGADKKEPIDYDKPFIGLEVVPLADFTGFAAADLPKPPTVKGMVVTDTPAYGPACKAGVTKLSIVTTINARTMEDLESYKAALENLEPGKKVTVKFYELQNPRTPKGKPVWKSKTASVTPSTRRKSILDNIRIHGDEIEEVDFVYQKDCDNVHSRESRMYLYFSEKDGAAGQLRLCICYVASDWLFIKGFIFKHGDDSYTLPADRFNVKNDNGNGKVWEWIDIPVEDAKLYKTLVEMSQRFNVTMRYTGDQYKKDRDVSSEELAAMRTVLAAFEMMGGEVPK